jgi:hypothetical protein
VGIFYSANISIFTLYDLRTSDNADSCFGLLGKKIEMKPVLFEKVFGVKLSPVSNQIPVSAKIEVVQTPIGFISYCLN